MTGSPVTVKETDPVRQAAKMMRDQDIGNVLVLRDGAVCGIVTDRDIAIRAVAEGKDPDKTTVKEVASTELVAISPDDDVARAVRIMREKTVRRLPVVDHGKLVGVVSIGDLALERDDGSALADVSAAPGNR